MRASARKQFFDRMQARMHDVRHSHRSWKASRMYSCIVLCRLYRRILYDDRYVFIYLHRVVQ